MYMWLPDGIKWVNKPFLFSIKGCCTGSWHDTPHWESERLDQTLHFHFFF